MKKCLMLLSLLLLLPALAQADDLVRQISVSGQAKESIKPDTAMISATVSARHEVLSEAKKEHDAKLRALLEVAERYGIQGKNLSTGRASIHPQWKWEKNTQQFIGYVMQTTINMESQSLDTVGKLLEAVVEVKPEQMQGPHFYLENTKPIEDKLRVAALQDAKTKAEALAREAGLKLGKPISISDSWQMPQPVMRREMAMVSKSYAAEAAPVAPPAGEQEVAATINVVYEMMP